MRNFERGFTLIELMIVVAIIGILAAVAIPAYQDYIARAQVSEAVSLLGAGKTGLTEYYNDKGSWPTQAGSVMGTTAGKYTSIIQFKTGQVLISGTLQIEATMRSSGINASIVDKSVALLTQNGGKTWACTITGTTRGSGPLDAKYVPGACK